MNNVNRTAQASSDFYPSMSSGHSGPSVDLRVLNAGQRALEQANQWNLRLSAQLLFSVEKVHKIKELNQAPSIRLWEAIAGDLSMNYSGASPSGIECSKHFEEHIMPNVQSKVQVGHDREVIFKICRLLAHGNNLDFSHLMSQVFSQRGKTYTPKAMEELYRLYMENHSLQRQIDKSLEPCLNEGQEAVDKQTKTFIHSLKFQPSQDPTPPLVNFKKRQQNPSTLQESHESKKPGYTVAPHVGPIDGSFPSLSNFERPKVVYDDIELMYELTALFRTDEGVDVKGLYEYIFFLKGQTYSKQSIIEFIQDTSPGRPFVYDPSKRYELIDERISRLTLKDRDLGADTEDLYRGRIFDQLDAGFVDAALNEMHLEYELGPIDFDEDPLDGIYEKSNSGGSIQPAVSCSEHKRRRVQFNWTPEADGLLLQCLASKNPDHQQKNLSWAGVPEEISKLSSGVYAPSENQCKNRFSHFKNSPFEAIFPQDIETLIQLSHFYTVEYGKNYNINVEQLHKDISKYGRGHNYSMKALNNLFNSHQSRIHPLISSSSNIERDKERLIKALKLGHGSLCPFNSTPSMASTQGNTSTESLTTQGSKSKSMTILLEQHVIDRLLLQARNEQNCPDNNVSWSKVSDRLFQLSGKPFSNKQCRERFMEHLRKGFFSVVFKNDKAKVSELVSLHPGKWAKLSERIKDKKKISYTDNCLKNYFHSLLRKDKNFSGLSKKVIEDLNAKTVSELYPETGKGSFEKIDEIIRSLTFTNETQET